MLVYSNRAAESEVAQIVENPMRNIYRISFLATLVALIAWLSMSSKVNRNNKPAAVAQNPAAITITVTNINPVFPHEN